ncbi:MAG: hypothetical protein WCZ23_09175 [Rhodospirillaceae bacterium]
MFPFVAPRAHYARPIRRILILARESSPTADIYLDDRLRGAGVPVERADVRAVGRAGAGDDPATLLTDGTFVIVVRYLTRRAASALRGRAEALAGVAYLMDDDMPHAWRSPGLAWPYRLGLAARWLETRSTMAGLVSEVWLSSDGLMGLHGHLPGVHRLDPLFLEPPRRPLRVFYHGVSSHEGDALWLRPVVADVQARRDDIVFEIIGSKAVARAYAGIPRCRVVPSMNWPDYISATAAGGWDIGLAPLAPTEFNAARSHTKFFDIARSGAAGIFADQGPYRAVVGDGHNGLLRPHEPDAWRDAILMLADNPDLRRAMAAAALATARELDRRERDNPLFARFFSAPSAD